MHTQPVQLGAGIEALQRAYRELNKSEYKTRLLNPKKAAQLKREFLKIVDAMIPEETEEKKSYERRHRN